MMHTAVPEPGMFSFMGTQVRRLMSRFSLSYLREDTCVEYFLHDTGNQAMVSLNLILSHDRFAKGLYVSKFYPQLYLTQDSRFLSAACFYLMIHHSVGLFGLADHCRVSLETDSDVFDEFYSRLPEFHFKIAHLRPCRRVCLYGSYQSLPIDTALIRKNRKLFL
jgi:hypothetical protein